MVDTMLTTIDNPYNPFTQFDEWYAFDVQKGYHTCAYIARVALTSNELSDEDEALAIGEAMRSILTTNVTGNYLEVDESFVPREIETTLDVTD